MGMTGAKPGGLAAPAWRAGLVAVVATLAALVPAAMPAAGQTPTPTATGTPEATATGTPGATATGTPGPTATVTVTPTGAPTTTPTPSATPAPAPAVPHDSRYFAETRYRIDNDRIWEYFNARGRIEIFGFPVSRTFALLGCAVQIFQRQIAQVCGDRGIALMNVLDELFPYTQVNFARFPEVDGQMKARTPGVDEPEYDYRILQFVRDNAPNVYLGVETKFAATFFGLITAEMIGVSDPGLVAITNLEVWGAPISPPRFDPGNTDFVYQRFQRGIMHHITSQRVTRGILLADYVKQVMRAGDGLPIDLREQAQGDRLFAQYCPGASLWLCRPEQLPGTDLTFAFEVG